MLSSIVRQLLRQADNIPKTVKELFDRYQHSSPPADRLLSAIKKLLKNPGQYFIIIDALDECSLHDHQRQSLCESLKDICEWALPDMHLLVTSRREADLVRALDPLVTFPPISIQAEVIASDVLKYVRTELAEHERLKKWPEKVKTEIEEALVRKADGM
jgi:hypothetical protein